MTLSSQSELQKLGVLLEAYQRIPEIFKSSYGTFLERALANIRSGTNLNTYDFVDVLCSDGSIGYQVKATKRSTVVTWMRAKIPQRNEMIRLSMAGSQEDRQSATQALGDAIIAFANLKVQKSFTKYPRLTEINYARLIYSVENSIYYEEAPLCTKDHPKLFNEQDFSWAWRLQLGDEFEVDQSEQEETEDQVSSSSGASRTKNYSLQGTYKPTGRRWWAWHGSGDSQLHFLGEQDWLAMIFAANRVDRKNYSLELDLAREKFALEEFMSLVLDK